MWYELDMERDISSELTARMPIIPHETAAGVDCCGCIVAVVEGNNVELRCNECGAVVGVVQLDILKGLFGLDCATACPRCGKEHVRRLRPNERLHMSALWEGPF
jgi:predicted RNA-binding Zn-ribbon protein involved in translation (DUF1610 family)